MEKNGTFSLFDTSVNGNVTFAYIMTFYCKGVHWVAVPIDYFLFQLTVTDHILI